MTIPDQWYPLLASASVRRKPVAVRRLGERWVLWRDAGGRAVCMPDRCPHRGVALSRGRVRDGTLECGYHGFRFAADGACVRMPCEGRDAKIPAGMRVAPRVVREAHGLVWTWYGEAREDLPEIPWFEQARAWRGATAEGALDWPLNQVRTTESNFDLHHTPWLHRSIAPVGARLDPLDLRVDGTHIVMRGELRHEDRPRGMPFLLEFKAPTLTYIELTPRLQFVNADCPIDEQNTWRFVRYHQDYLHVPVLDRLLCWLAVQLEWRVAQLRQDLPMVATQEPREPDRALDQLVRADAGTAAYLKLRRRLLAEAEQRSGPQPARPRVVSA